LYAWTLGAGLCASAALLSASNGAPIVVRTTVGLVAMRDVCLIAVLLISVGFIRARERREPVPAPSSTPS
jgi:hypothetical protein